MAILSTFKRRDINAIIMFHLSSFYITPPPPPQCILLTYIAKFPDDRTNEPQLFLAWCRRICCTSNNVVHVTQGKGHPPSSF